MNKHIFVLIVVGIVISSSVFAEEPKPYKPIKSCTVLHTDKYGNSILCPEYGVLGPVMTIEYPNGEKEIIDTGANAHNDVEQLRYGQFIILQRINELEKKLDSVIEKLKNTNKQEWIIGKAYPYDTVTFNCDGKDSK